MNEQNENMENTEKKETVIDKMKGFAKKHKKGLAIGILALLGAGAAGAVAASRKNKNNDEDDVSDVSWQDLETDDNESESTSDAE